MDAPNRYRIVRTLGRGGMAEVFEGLLVGDTGFTRRIALKRLLPEHAHVEWYARAFIDEARIGSQLHHGNIASILDFGTMDGLPFQVMELIDGLNLAELRTRVVESSGSFAPELALEIIIAVAHGLDYAHHALDGEGRPMGIVHRDITPDNVLVSWAGEVKLIDFGIALAHRRVEATTVGVVKGKLDYMAPEQVVAADVDARADLFATGCLLHFLLTGESPVSGRERDRLMSGQVKIDPTLSPMLAALIARATEHDRTRRWSSAEELAKAAETLLMRLQARSSAPRLRETVGKLRAARPAPSPAAKVGRLAELFQLDLVLEPEAEKSGLRRFASAMYRPAGLAEEQPTKTTVDFTNPNVQLAMSPHETANLRGPSASNTTRTPAPVLEMSGATRLDGTEIESTRVHPTSHDVGKAEATEVVTAPGGGPTESGAGDTQTMPKAQQAPALVLGGVRLTQVLRTLARAKLYVGEHASLQAPRVVVVLSEGEPAKIATQIVRVAQVRDPRVALIFESGQSEGRSFFVTESPLGQCLLDLAESERPLAPARGALWARQLAFAVAALRVGGVELEAIDPEAIFISEIFGTEALRVLPIDALGVKNPANDAAVLAPSMRVIVKALGEQSDTSPVARGLEEILRLMTGPEAAKMTAETLVGRIDQLLMSSPVFMARGTPTPMMTPTPVSSTFGIREIFALSVLALGMGAVAFALLTKPGATANYAPIEQRPPPSPTMVEPHAVVPAETPTPTPTQATPSAAPVEAPSPTPTPEERIPRTSPRRTPSPTPTRPTRPSREALRARWMQALLRRHLTVDDVDNSPGGAALLARFNKAFTADSADLDEAVTALEAHAAQVPLDAALLKRRGDKVKSHLYERVSSLPPEEGTRLEKIYLDLKDEMTMRGPVGEAQAQSILERLERLDQDILRKR